MKRFQNFNNPVALAMRLLASKDRIAKFVLFREAIVAGLVPVDWVMTFFERIWIERMAQEHNLPLILILGGSRSGTTVLYQVLAHSLPVSYLSNLNAIFPRSTITARRLFAKFFREPEHSLENFFGSVRGLNSPNDGFFLWNRWLGYDRGSVNTSIHPTDVAEATAFLDCWGSTFRTPLLNKNNRNLFAVPFFEKATRGRVVYVIIRRDPRYVVQSLIKSRKAIQGTVAKGWGLASKDSNLHHGSLAYVDDICAQVWAVEKMLREVESCIEPKRVISIHYSDLCADPVRVVNLVSTKVFDRPAELQSVSWLSPLKSTDFRYATFEEWNRLTYQLKQLYGESDFGQNK